LGIQNLDSDEVDVLGHTKGLASNGTGDVATVAIFVGVLHVLESAAESCLPFH
jgi:hypothetical protein